MLFFRASSATASAGSVALTFDDLPGLTILPDQAYVDYLNAAILYKLRRRHVRATGFVNEGKIADLDSSRQVANLAAWIKAGMELGNHTYSHPSLNEVGAQAYIADIERGEKVTNALLRTRRQTIRYFRAPYLETGATLRIKDDVAKWLRAHGYQMAPVTIDADDWEFAEPYDDALARGDEAEQRRIRAEYLAYTSVRIGWAQASARLLFGRDIAHVMLLHCTRLNADALDEVLTLLRRAHLRTVSLAVALKDPAYQLPDTYVGSDGIDWLERWANAKGIELPDNGNDDPPADIQQAYDRVDDDRH